jgi:fructose/tagatose bisphosphate aldolase
MDDLALKTALASNQEKTRFVQELSDKACQTGVYPASIGPIYHALKRNECAPMTIPAFNVRGMTYDIARVIWRTAIRLEVGPIIFELAPSEAEVGNQSYEEYAAVVMAAAAREGWQGPVFLQGDHITVESLQTLGQIKTLCHRLISAGYYQLDIDASHIPASEDAPLEVFHRDNAQATAELTRYLRSIQPDAWLATIGAEVGEIGQRNTTITDIETFMDAYISGLGSEVDAFDKLSVQTGTRHGGIVLADGTCGEMALDLSLAADLSKLVRQEYGIAGLVQHGASTLSLENLACLPEHGVIEVHLATGIQNIVFDHSDFPDGLRKDMITRLTTPSQNPEGDASQLPIDELTTAQRFYHARWEAWGLYKAELWQMPASSKVAIGETLETWVEALFYALQVVSKSETLSQFYSTGK